jgi:hypothetical protein
MDMRVIFITTIINFKIGCKWEGIFPASSSLNILDSFGSLIHNNNGDIILISYNEHAHTNEPFISITYV